MPFRFSEYMPRELIACGAVFVGAAHSFCANDTKAATVATLDFFRQAAAPDVRVFPDARFGQMLLDLCHIDYPERGIRENGLAFWDRALEKPIRARLALESEWGKSRASNRSIELVLNDAQKLAFFRADLKVMLFASCKADDRRQFVERIGRLRECAGDNSPWLWIDVPWCNSPLPAFGTFGISTEILNG
jgi:hypothetical protein